MLLILAYCIAGWLLTGILIWLIKVFLYFRGPVNYAEWMSLSCLKFENDVETASRISQSPYVFCMAMLVVNFVIGPISILEFLSLVSRINRLINLNQSKE